MRYLLANLASFGHTHTSAIVSIVVVSGLSVRIRLSGSRRFRPRSDFEAANLHPYAAGLAKEMLLGHVGLGQKNREDGSLVSWTRGALCDHGRFRELSDI